jgi:branched-chain amino acid aminotransferase
VAEPIKLLTYLNGRVMPHSEAEPTLRRINETSSGGYYDIERTFSGAPFKLREHLRRLFNGLEHSGVDPGLSIAEMERITLGLVEANTPLLPAGGEFTVTQVVSTSGTEATQDVRPVNVVVYCQPLEFSRFARGYVDGVRIITPSTYGVPGGDEAAVAGGQQVMPLMNGKDGSITECQGANFMFARNGRVKLPDRLNVLPGVSMQTVLELASSLKIPVDEGKYSQLHVYDADEAFVSSTRFCVLPVATLNGVTVGRRLPGEITSALLGAWKALVGVDFVQQALAHLPGDETT